MITYAEEAIRNLLEAPNGHTTRSNPSSSTFLSYQGEPVRLRSLGSYSAFAHVQARHPRFVRLHDGIAHQFTLYSVELFDGQNVKVFLDINQSVEWTENIYLDAWFESVKEAEPNICQLVIRYRGLERYTVRMQFV